MSDFSDLKAQIAEYANRQDWSDQLVTGYIRQCEQKLNAELRIDRMIKTDTGLVVSRCAQLPDTWLEMDLVKIAAQTPTGWWPIHYMPRDDFFKLTDTPYSNATAATNLSTQGYYTIEGRSILFGGPPDTINGVQFQISYYSEVPVFADDTPSWVFTKYPSLYLYGSLCFADLHAVGEEDKAGMLKQLCEDMIQKLNAQHRYARASGSKLSRARIRSFG